jgi:hypothetical protein
MELSLRINSVISVDISAGDAGLSARVDSAMGLLANRSNVISALTAAGLSDFASLVVTLATSAIYDIRGCLIFETLSLQNVRFGVSVPTLGAGGSYIRMDVALTNVSGALSVGPTGGLGIGHLVLSAVAAGQHVIVSVANPVSTIRALWIDGMISMSTTGTLRIMAGSGGANSILNVRAGFLRATRVGG